MDKKNISLFKIDVSELSVVATNRQLIIEGDTGAEFNIVIYDSSNKWYDFTTNTFSTGFSTNKNLKVEMIGKRFTRNVTFSGGGITYTIFLLAPPDKNTELSLGFGGKNVASRTLSSVANATVTLALATDSSNNYETLPTSLTSTGNSTVSGSTTLDIDWTVTNKAHNSYAFGLIIAADASLETMQWDDNWYFSTTETVDGAITSATSVVVDDLTDLVVGMRIHAVSSGSLSGTPTVTAIDENTKTLTLSAAQTFADGITLTFRAYGSSLISTATGLNMELGQLTPKIVDILETAVRANVSASAEITLTGAYGLAGGNVVSFSGINVSEEPDNINVTEVAHTSSTIAAITASGPHTLEKGTLLRFIGSVREIRTVGTATIKQYPTSDRTIYLDLDKFITVGAAS